MTHSLPLLAAAVAVAIFAIAFETRPQTPSSVHLVQDSKTVEAFTPELANGVTQPTMLAGDEVNMAAVEDLMAKRQAALGLSDAQTQSQAKMLRDVLGKIGR